MENNFCLKHFPPNSFIDKKNAKNLPTEIRIERHVEKVLYSVLDSAVVAIRTFHIYHFKGNFMENNFGLKLFTLNCVFYEKTTKNWFWGALGPFREGDAPTTLLFEDLNFFIIFKTGR